jgi:hypothetical protein
MNRDLQKGIALALLEGCLIVAALFAAVLVGGPIARSIFGVPAGFRQDFVSVQAARQALIVQGISVALVLAFIGVLCGRLLPRRPHRITMTLASPLVVAVAFVAFKLAFESMPVEHDIEYYNVGIGTVLVLMSPLFLGISCIASRRISASRGDRPGSQS